MCPVFKPIRIAVAFISLLGANAQIPSERPDANIELRFEPNSLLRGVPQAFTFKLVNRGAQDIRLPNPAIQCFDRDNGRIELHLYFTPFDPAAPGKGGGCGGGVYDGPRLLERAQHWKVLRPGEALVVTAPRDRLGYEGKELGIYEFFAMYIPPVLDEQDQKTLTKAGINFPRGAATTAHLTFVKRQ